MDRSNFFLSNKQVVARSQSQGAGKYGGELPLMFRRGRRSLVDDFAFLFLTEGTWLAHPVCPDDGPLSKGKEAAALEVWLARGKVWSTGKREIWLHIVQQMETVLLLPSQPPATLPFSSTLSFFGLSATLNWLSFGGRQGDERPGPAFELKSEIRLVWAFTLSLCHPHSKLVFWWKVRMDERSRKGRGEASLKATSSSLKHVRRDRFST